MSVALFSNLHLQQYICQVFLVHLQKTLFHVNAHLLRLTAHHRTQKMHTRQEPVMKALEQDQVPQTQEWRTNADDVCLARKQGQCHRTVHSG